MAISYLSVCYDKIECFHSLHAAVVCLTDVAPLLVALYSGEHERSATVS